MGEHRQIGNAWEYSSRSDDKEYLLALGSQFRLLRDGAVYTVRQVNTPSYTAEGVPNRKVPPLLTLVAEAPYTGAMPSITISGYGSKTVGTRADCDVVLSGNNEISRVHASFKFDEKLKGFTLICKGLNPSCVRRVKELHPSVAKDPLRADKTITDVHAALPADEEMVLYREVGIRPGMIIDLLPPPTEAERRKAVEAIDKKVAAIPTYVVRKATGGVHPELVIEAQGELNGYPARMELSGDGASKTIGRMAGDYHFDHPRISRKHAVISWDKEAKEWIYATPYQVPVVHVGSDFLKDMYARARKVAPASVEKAQVQIKGIDALMGSMQEFRESMANVQRMEEKTRPNMSPEEKRGGKTEDSQQGYNNWVQAYRVLYNETLKREEKDALTLARRAITAIAKYRGALREIEKTSSGLSELPDTREGILMASRISGHAPAMQVLIEDEMQGLREVPPKPIFPLSGYRGHHTVTKIEREGDRHIVTTYNTGQGLLPAPDDRSMAMGMYRQVLSPKVKVEDFVRLLNECKMLAYDDPDNIKIRRQIEGCLSPILPGWRKEKPQGKGNCTTRSTREMLKDILPAALFADLHRHVSNPEICDPADVMAALQRRRDALVEYVRVHGGGKVSKLPDWMQDWSKSVDDLYLSKDIRLDDSAVSKWVQSRSGETQAITPQGRR